MISSRCNYLFLLILSVLVFGCANLGNFLERFPASSNELDEIVISKLQLETKGSKQESKSFYLIGKRCNSLGGSCFDWSNSNFKLIEGRSTLFEAKFLLTQHGNTLEDIYSFEYGNSRKRKILKKRNKNGETYSTVKLPKGLRARLPKHFLNITQVKNQRRPYSFLSYFLRAVSFTPLSAFSETLVEIIELIENKKVYQSAYLSRIVELMLLDDKYPNFMKEVGRDAVISIGAALRIRFRSQITGVTSSIGTNQKESQLYFQKHLEYKTETQSINMGKLIQRANEENLVVQVVSRDLAILLYDPNESIHIRGTDDLLLNTSEMLDKYSGDKLIALGIFTTIDSLGPTKVLDFERPNLPIRNERITKFLEYGTSLGLSFIDNSNITTPLQVGKFFTKLILKKSGKVYQKNLIESEATLKALIDTGAVELDPKEVSIKYFLTFLKESGFDTSELMILEKRLGSEDELIVKKTINEIVEAFNERQVSKRFLSKLSSKRTIANKVLATERFKKFLSSQKRIDKYFKKLEKKRSRVENKKKRVAKRKQRRKLRKERREKRRLSRRLKKDGKNEKSISSLNTINTNDNSAIVFMIDGLRPDRLDEAVNKGLMPNLKKYFYDHGVHFNSFTTKSLTLPSWSSILTGYDIDTHGVRSNGPMNRVDAKPQHNYIDPRKDLLSRKNRRESRSLQHLKESGLKWLPDYFNPDEVVTNYLPINSESFPAVGKLVKNLIENYDEALFGAFSGSMALDRAGALQTAKKIYKNPSKTKLILNWYSCVDVFAHHNNLALDRCYKELDEILTIVLDAAKQDEVLKDAHLFIVSDHGHSGGHESEHSRYKLFKEGSYFNNTGLNLTTLFAGDYANYSHFDYYPYVMESPHINNDLKFLMEYQLHPFRYKYKSRKKKFKDRDPDVMIDYSGDSLAQVYLKDPNRGWGEKLSFSRLSNMNGRNLLEDLLDIKLRNYTIYDKKTKNKVKNLTKGHPILAYAHALDSCSQDDIESIVKEEFVMARPAILVKGTYSKYGMILTKKINNKIFYKYHLLDSFVQEDTLKCFGILSKDSSRDIFQQHYMIKDQWNSKIDFIQKMKDSRFPTSLVSLVASLTLDKSLVNNKKRVAEIPDFILLANLGFNFNSGAITEADHGNLSRRESNNTFIYSNMKLEKFSDEKKAELKEKVILNYYLTPFVLDVTNRHLGTPDPNWPQLDEFLRP